MTPLPFTPEALPDELLGSWLARVACANDRGAWGNLLVECGFRRNYLDSDFFGLPAFRPEQQRLLDQLGMGAEGALMRHTLAPYWMLFDSTLKGRLLAGSQRRGATLWQRSAPMRFCSGCIADDIERCGVCYWHRAAQLPNVMACSTHACHLNTMCIRCRKSVFIERRLLAPPLTFLCGCGADLRLQVRGFDGATAHLRLAEFSASLLDVASGSDLSVDQRAIAAYLRSVGIKGSAHGRYQQVISEAFPTSAGETLSLRPDAATAGAKELCVVGAALSLNARQVVSALFRTEAPPAKKRIRTATLDEAKKALSKYPLAATKMDGLDKTFAFWRCALDSPDWLYERFPRLVRLEIPSIAADRSSIKRLIRKRGRASARQSPASRRALIRDATWAALLLDTPERERWNTKRSTLNKDRLLKTIDVLAVPGRERPALLTRSLLGKETGLTNSQIARLANAKTDVGRRILEVNGTFHERTLRWAIGELLRCNQSVTFRAVFALARVSAPENIGLLKALLQEYDVRGDLVRQHRVGGVRDSRPYAAGRVHKYCLLADAHDLPRFKSFCAERGEAFTDVVHRLIMGFLDGGGFRNRSAAG